MAKRRQGLGGSAAHHASEAGRLARMALREFHSASWNIRRGFCSSAVRPLVRGSGYAQAAYLHKWESGGKMPTRIMDRRDALAEALSKCIVEDRHRSRGEGARHPERWRNNPR